MMFGGVHRCLPFATFKPAVFYYHEPQESRVQWFADAPLEISPTTFASDQRYGALKMLQFLHPQTNPLGQMHSKVLMRFPVTELYARAILSLSLARNKVHSLQQLQQPGSAQHSNCIMSNDCSAIGAISATFGCQLMRLHFCPPVRREQICWKL